ncbi:hypothetical protein JTB14_014319 [Gonioctena quinquepunctata]|nr:hypothetical protein JTB14_014319 [Gonioctena quinquepunctata]
MIATAKAHIPRGYRKKYVPGWSLDSESPYEEYLETKDPEIGEQLLHSIVASRRKKWAKTTESFDSKHSCRQAWSLLKKPGPSPPPPPPAT